MSPVLHRFSIRTQVLLLALTIVLPAVATFAWFHFDDARHARDEARREVANLAVAATANLDRFLGQTEAMMARLAARPQVRALDARNCDPIVAEFVKLNPEFNQLGIRDLEGNIICSYVPNPIARIDPREFPWFEEGVRSGKFNAGNAFPAPRVRRWVSVLTHPILDDSGKVAALLILPVDLVKLSTQLLGFVPKNSLVTIADRKDVALMR